MALRFRCDRIRTRCETAAAGIPRQGYRCVVDTVAGMPHHVVSDLVANVLAIAVHPGDTVEVGAEIVLLESMKMEIPVLTEQAGTVTEVKIEVGDVVQEGDILAIIE